MKKISIVIPCYNSEKTLADVIEETVKSLTELKEYDYEIILVCDHSPDKVYEVISEAVSKNDKITGINFTKNFGQHAALMAGYRQCTGDIVVSFDDDGQTPVEDLHLLLRAIEHEDYDIVFAEYDEIKQSMFRKWGSRINAHMQKVLLNKPQNLKITSFCAMKKYIVDSIVEYENPFPYIAGLMFRITKNIGNVRTKHRERIHGKSNYTIRKLLSLWLNGFTAFSVKPLRIATVIGCISAFVGFVFLVAVIIAKLFVNPNMAAGYSSTIAVLLFIGGIMMLMLGLIGEYIGRIYMSINKSPQYVIKDFIKKKSD